MSFTATWMELEIIILSEVRQRKTNTMKHRLHVESKKIYIYINEFIYKIEIDS